MAGFVIKVKTKSGQKVVNGLTQKTKISDLKLKLSDVTGIPKNSLYILSGFPPKPLDSCKDDAALDEVGIVSGDTLIVEEKQPSLSSSEEESNIKKHDDSVPRSHIVDTEMLDHSPGVLMKKIVPSDNSCLFTSVGFVLNGKVDTTCGNFMRSIIAESVAANTEEYSEAMLGRPNAEYCEWIKKTDSWGGAIELAILSWFYGLEIAVVDSINAIVNRFGEDQHYAQRVFLLFDGIHYDPLYLEPLDGGSIQTIFPASDERLLIQATELAGEAKSSRQFTDVQKFTLKCMVCNVMLNGQVAAQQHAKETGHMNFGEVVP